MATMLGVVTTDAAVAPALLQRALKAAVERIRAVGNAASEGAKMALMSFREREVAFELPAFVEYLELSGAADFNERFIANLAFPALESLERAE